MPLLIVRHEGPTIPFLALFLALAFARQGGPTIPFLVLAFARQLGPTILSAACARGGVMRAGVAATRPPATVSSAAALLLFFRRVMASSPMRRRIAGREPPAGVSRHTSRLTSPTTLPTSANPLVVKGPPQSSIRLGPSYSVLRPRFASRPSEQWGPSMHLKSLQLKEQTCAVLIRRHPAADGTVQITRNSFPLRLLAGAGQAISQAATAGGKMSLGRL